MNMLTIEDIGKYKAPKIMHPPIQFMTDSELISDDCPLIFDIECFSNYFLIAFMSYATGNITLFERSQDTDFNVDKLKWIMDNRLVVGFNSTHYDIPMLWASLAGLWTERLKELSQTLIMTNKKFGEIEKEFDFKVGYSNHIDLQQVAPAAAQFISLKHYGARMHVARLQDLPIAHDVPLLREQAVEIKLYCINDLHVTAWLYTKLKVALDLRAEMGIDYHLDLRSRSDAQIAERVITSELEDATGAPIQHPRITAGRIIAYKKPDYIRFYTQRLQCLYEKILQTRFILNVKGKLFIYRDKQMKAATNFFSIDIGNSTYRLGIGGLHSSEKNKTHWSDSDAFLVDRDVTSYYPQIILNQELYPEHIGPDFLKVYQDMVTRRLEAKRINDTATAHSLKICINGVFGKFGNRYSKFYSPELLLQVTLTGQLSLLMLIEMLEWCKIPVVSANTDGIVIKCPHAKHDEYLQTVEQWERITDFKTEELRYVSLHSRDVNNYIAIPIEGKIKAKGTYTNLMSFKDVDRESLMKNPNGTIVTEAVMRFLFTCRNPNPTTIEKTIRACTDITKFLFSRRVNGGAVKDQQYLGKVVRWYQRLNEFGVIKCKENNKAGIKATVSETAGSYPMQELTAKLPTDIDYQWYIRRGHSILKDIGYYRNETQGGLFE